MNKRRWCVFLAMFFLLSDLTFSQIASATNYPLTQIKVTANCPDVLFKKIFDSICFGLSVYKSDVIGQFTKEALIKNFGKVVLNPSISFDLENIDIIKKGWTRYYPFSIDGKSFILRIFLTEEKAYQPAVAILYEGNIQNPAVTFQVLPSLNEILADCKIKPSRTYSTHQVDSSS